MKWPIIEEIWRGPIRILRTDYLTKMTEIALDTDKCTTCNQCTKVCPKDAITAVKIIPGVKKTKLERIPIFSSPNKCVFCGLCMSFCPYNAITMKEDGRQLEFEDLKLIQKNVIPKMTAVKVGKVELADTSFQSNLFKKIAEKIEIKRAIR